MHQNQSPFPVPGGRQAPCGSRDVRRGEGINESSRGGRGRVESTSVCQVDKCRKLGANVILKGVHIGEAKDFALSDPQVRD